MTAMTAPCAPAVGTTVRRELPGGTGAAALAVPAGHRDDPETLLGLAHLVEHLALDRGDDDGWEPVVRHAFTTADVTVFEVETLPGRLEQAADELVARVLAALGPTAARVAHELDVVDVEGAGADGPGSVLGTAATRRRIGADDVAAFHRGHYRPERCALAVVGDGITGAVAGPPASPVHDPLPSAPLRVHSSAVAGGGIGLRIGLPATALATAWSLVATLRPDAGPVDPVRSAPVTVVDDLGPVGPARLGAHLRATAGTAVLTLDVTPRRPAPAPAVVRELLRCLGRRSGLRPGAAPAADAVGALAAVDRARAEAVWSLRRPAGGLDGLVAAADAVTAAGRTALVEAIAEAVTRS